MLTFTISPCSFCIPMLLPELFFFSIFGCQPFASSFPSGVYVCFGERGKWRGELQRANSVQGCSMAYLVVSQTVSLPSFKMWLSVLGIFSLLHLKFSAWLLVSYTSCNPSFRGCFIFWLAWLYWYALVYLACWHLSSVVERGWKDENMDSCSYHVSLGSTRTIPSFGGLSPPRWPWQSVRCYLWRCVGVRCPRLEEDWTAGWSHTKRELLQWLQMQL